MHISARPRRNVSARYAGVQSMPPSAAGELELAPTESTRPSTRTHTRTRARARRISRVAATVVLSAMLAFALAGCRDSDVLTEKIIGEPFEYPTDETLTPVRWDDPNADESSSTQNEVESQEETASRKSTPDYDPETPKQEQTAQQVEAETPNSAPASSGNQAAQGAGAGATTQGLSAIATEEGNGGAGAVITVVPGAGVTDSNNAEAEGNGNGGEAGDAVPWNPGQSGNGSGNGGTSGATYNDGTFTRLPENKSKIAAAGPYATIVQSIGGPGALAAAPQQWLDRLPAQAYSDGAELANVKGIPEWGDGTALNDEAIQAIIDSGAEVVLTSDSYGGVVTDEQAAAFNAAGVDVVVMPMIGYGDIVDEDISQTVAVVGELLKDSDTTVNGLTAKEMANEWRRQHDLALERTKADDGGYVSTVSGVTGSEMLILCNGHGASSTSPGNCAIITQVAPERAFTSYTERWWVPLAEGGAPGGNALLYGVGVHSGMNPTGMHRNQYQLYIYYMQHAGVSTYPAGLSYSSGAGSSFYGMNEEMAANFDYEPYRYGYTVTGLVREVNVDHGLYNKEAYQLGRDAAYAKVIVRNKFIAERMRASSLVAGNVYNVGAPYQILVMPAGISGSWTDGNFESFLIAPWAYSEFRDMGTSYSDGFANDFYSTFYRCGPAGILDGDGNYGDGHASWAGYGGYNYSLTAGG